MDEKNKLRGQLSNSTLQMSSTAVSLAIRMKDRNAAIPCLVVMRGLDIGRVIPLETSPVVVGRDEDCEIQLDDEGISRRHVQLLREGDRFRIEDLGSTNGTFINGDPLESRVLEEGDKVLLGRSTVLKFTHQDDLEMEFQKGIHESASVDGLTGALNRKTLDQRLEAEWSFAHRHETDLAVLMLDVDHFKIVNDTYGHGIGDEVLQAVANLLTETVRLEDLVGRYGGEEFLVAVRDVGPRGATRLANRLRRLIEKLDITARGEHVAVTVSLGVASLRQSDVSSIQALVRLADQRLYAAKRTGRNRVVSEDL